MLQKKNIPLLNKDLWFTFLCAAVISFTSFVLYQEITSRLSYSGTTKVGTITFKRNTAQRKYASFAVWEILDKTSPVYNLDTIRTSPDSDAKLMLDGNVDIALSEQSLIVINTTPRGFDIEFTGGSISSVAASRLTIRYKNTSIVVEEGTDFTLKEMDDGGVRLTVNDGKATVDNKQSVTIVESNKSAVINEKTVTVTELLFKKRSPADSCVLVTGKATKLVNFSWQTDRTDSTLIVSMTRDFSTPIYNQQSSSASLDLQPGRYYWKIVSGSVESEVFAFNINKEPVPRILTPLNNSVVSTVSGNVTFEAGWLNSGGADSYTLLVYPQGSSSPIKEISTLNNSTYVDSIAAGTYELRVRPNFSYAKEATDVISPPITVRIESVSSLPKPVITSPAEGAELSDTLVNKEGLSVFWRGSRETERYETGIFTDSSLSTAVERTTVSSGTFRVQSKLTPGTYYIAVTPFRGAIKGESAIRTLTIKSTPGPVLQSPAENSSVITESSFNVSWSDPQKAFSYIVDIATDSSFTDIVWHANTPFTSKTACLSKPGIYYARASVAAGDGKTILLEGSPSRFSVAGVLRDPVFKDFAKYSDINISTSEKFATAWEPLTGATSYKLDLVRLDNGRTETVVFSIDTTYLYQEIPNFKTFEKGRYFFRLTAFEEKDGLMLNASKPVKHYFDVLKTQEVKFITPSIIYIRVN